MVCSDFTSCNNIKAVCFTTYRAKIELGLGLNNHLLTLTINGCSNRSCLPNGSTVYPHIVINVKHSIKHLLFAIISMVISQFWRSWLGFLAPKTLKIIWLSSLSTLSVSDEGYSRYASCPLNLISTFLLCLVLYYSSTIMVTMTSYAKQQLSMVTHDVINKWNV